MDIMGLARERRDPIAVLRTVAAALRLLRSRKASSNPNRQAVIRVAVRWLAAGLSDDYDIMLRLQVLEGAAGVPVDSWWRKGRRGLRAASDALASSGIKPEWLAANNSGLMGVVERTLQGAIRSYGVPWEPGDIIANALMGLKVDASREGRTTRPAYEAGVRLSKGILEGRETPQMAAKGTLGAFLARKVTNEAKRFKGDPLPEGEEGESLDISEDAPTRSPADFMAGLIFRNYGDPISQQVRALMKKVWSSPEAVKGKYSEPMLLWLEEAEKGNMLGSGGVAKLLGKSKSNISQGAWKRGWVAFFDAFWADRGLMDDMEIRLREEGYAVSLEKPTPVGITKMNDPLNLIFKKKPKGRKRANRRTLERIVTRWLSTGDVVNQVVRHTEESPDFPRC